MDSLPNFGDFIYVKVFLLAQIMYYITNIRVLGRIKLLTLKKLCPRVNMRDGYTSTKATLRLWGHRYHDIVLIRLNFPYRGCKS